MGHVMVPKVESSAIRDPEVEAEDVPLEASNIRVPESEAVQSWPIALLVKDPQAQKLKE